MSILPFSNISRPMETSVQLTNPKYYREDYRIEKVMGSKGTAPQIAF
jgi:hypothetical protein